MICVLENIAVGIISGCIVAIFAQWLGNRNKQK
ncbi:MULTISPECIES: type I toxin-antitoxin system Fst family toxin [unclassified Staphylococcus]|nr:MULTISPECIES: type I toxin-antitoxin system Fst family toxin [unclassified Staphylococcus]UXR78594.1 type I toxin-antitoxin system Fst family toxin [Staphylococcus sp. IVB6227]UXR82752.1 type I toxin-antitoxin system Fst family toxin [Staphylococcus sp. IVB6214]